MKNNLHKNRFNRRSLLKKTAAVAASTLLPLHKSYSKKRGYDDNYVVRENQKQGTTDWIIDEGKINYDNQTGPFLWNGPIRSSAIEGYCDRLYVKACQDISFHVSTVPSSQYTIDIYRIGYYGGTGGRHMMHIAATQGSEQATPTPNPTTNLVECTWPISHTINIPNDWLSGFYIAKLQTVGTEYQNYMSFVVADDRQCDYIFQVSDINSHCYNRWPLESSLYDKLGGASDSSWDLINVSSFNKPQAKLAQLGNMPLTMGAGEFMAWQYPMAYWMEQNGRDVSYISGLTLHYEGSQTLTRAKGYIVLGHDEYWTDTMFNNATTARDQGVSMAFLCGNTIGGRVGFSQSGGGTPDQRFTRIGGFSGENQLMGGETGGGVIGGGKWRIMQPNHWLFNGTGAVTGTSIQGLIGWEYHHSPAGSINGATVEQVAYDESDFYSDSPNSIKNGEHGNYTATYYDVTGGNNFVFNGATCWWAYTFDNPPGFVRSTWMDARQTKSDLGIKITENVLDEMVNRA